MQPFCAPLARSRRVSWRVSMLAMATVFSRTRYCESVCSGAEVAGQQGQVFDDQTCGMDFVGFDVFRH